MTTDHRLLKLAKRIAKIGIAAPPLADLPALLGVGEEELAVDLAALIDSKLAVVWEEAEAGPSLVLTSIAVEDPRADPRTRQLAKLIRGQRRDRLGLTRHSSKREMLAADVGPRGEGQDLLNAKADGAGGRDWTPPQSRDDIGETVYLMGLHPWEACQEGPAKQPAAWAARVDLARQRGETVEEPTACPVCKGVHAKAWDRYCLACDTSGKDGRVRFRGAPIDSTPRVGYKPDETLGGGTGKPAKVKKVEVTKMMKPPMKKSRRRSRKARART